MRLSGRFSIITGAKSGIGLATTPGFAAEGASVVLADIRDTSTEAAAIGSGCTGMFEDITDARSVAQLIDRTFQRFGRLDVLVNNAGVDLAKSVTETDETDWDRLMKVEPHVTKSKPSNE